MTVTTMPAKRKRKPQLPILPLRLAEDMRQISKDLALAYDTDETKVLQAALLHFYTFVKETKPEKIIVPKVLRAQDTSIPNRNISFQ
jgi:hypothetical protein